MPRKKITANDIPAKFRFILEMYGALERFVKNYNNSNWRYNINDRSNFKHLLGVYSFLWYDTPEGNGYWLAICKQDEPEITRETALLKERGV